MSENEKPESHLKPLKFRGNLFLWCLAGAAISGICLFLLTGLTPTPWLFLLYPILIGVLLLSLATLALHLLHRF